MITGGNMGREPLAEPHNNNNTAASGHPQCPSGRDYHRQEQTKSRTTLRNSTPPLMDQPGQHHWPQSKAKTKWQWAFPFSRVPNANTTSGIPPTQDYGDAIGPKPSNIFQLAYGNINGFMAVTHTNPKAIELRHWLKHMEVDFFACNESKINWARMPKAGRLPEMFRSENDLHTVAPYSSNESFAL